MHMCDHSDTDLECVAISRVRVMGFESAFVHHTVCELQNPLQPRLLVCIIHVEDHLTSLCWCLEEWGLNHYLMPVGLAVAAYARECRGKLSFIAASK